MTIRICVFQWLQNAVGTKDAKIGSNCTCFKNSARGKFRFPQPTPLPPPLPLWKALQLSGTFSEVTAFQVSLVFPHRVAWNVPFSIILLLHLRSSQKKGPQTIFDPSSCSPSALRLLRRSIEWGKLSFCPRRSSSQWPFCLFLVEPVSTVSLSQTRNEDEGRKHG